MTEKEIIQEFKEYSIAEQIALLKELYGVMKENPDNEISAELKEIEERLAIVEELYGFLAVEGQPAPTDEEIKEAYTNYLMEKYS